MYPKAKSGYLKLGFRVCELAIGPSTPYSPIINFSQYL